MTGIAGPFDSDREASAASLWAKQGREAGSMRAANLADLAAECGEAGVRLGAYDRVIVEWLAGYEPSTVAVVCGLVARAHAEAVAASRLAALAGEIDRRLENENVDRQTIAEDVADRLRMLACGVKPAVTLDPVQLDRVLEALADAAAYRKRQAGETCADCDQAPDDVCPDHLDDLDRSEVYEDLADLLRMEAGQ